MRYWCHYLSTLFTSTLDCCGSSLQQRGPLPHSTFHFQEDLCGVSISVLPSPIKSTCETIRLRGGGRNTRITLLTLEPLAHSLLAPRSDRLHARSPATVVTSVPSRPSRLLPLRTARGGKNWRSLGIERWRIVLPPTGTGKSRPAVSQWRGVASLGRQQRPLPHPYTHHPPPFTWRCAGSALFPS